MASAPGKPLGNPWDDLADAYERWLGGYAEPRPLLAERLVACVGDVADLDVLDAGCGEGHLSRWLAARGARVTGIDISPRLLEIARRKSTDGAIDYRLADLSRPIPDLIARFDRILSRLVLNDVADYRGFVDTLAELARPGARAAFAMNNPYSFLVRGDGHVTDYFADERGIYGGMSARMGGSVRYFHRTLEQYLDAFLSAGFRLTKLVDIPRDPLPPPGTGHFPFLMILGFEKPGA